jgi:hypothetical protein
MLKKILMVLLLAGFVYANDLDKGFEAAGKNDFKTAVELFSKACNEVNAIGCYSLGVMYENGQGVRQDYFKAVELYSSACDGGISEGCNNLGVSYRNGQGVRQDNEQALKYYGKACDMKNEIGCKNYSKLKQGY